MITQKDEKIKKEITFLSERKMLSKDEAKEYQVIVPGISFSLPHVAFAFESQETFLKWAQETRYGDLIKETMNKIKEAQNLEGTDISAVIERKKKFMSRIVEDLESLAKSTGLDMGSEEFFLRATTSSHPLDEPVFDPISLCSTLNSTCSNPFKDWLPLGCSNWPFGGGWPDLGWFGWNDRARSFRIAGQAWLYEDTWWKGRNLFLIGPWAGNLAQYGFDRAVSSVYVLR